MTKIKIAPESAKGKPIYGHFMPILLYAVEKGCRLDTGVISRPFHATRNGSEGNMYGDLSMVDVAERFDLPSTITIGGPHNRCLWDRDNNVKLCIYRE